MNLCYYIVVAMGCSQAARQRTLDPPSLVRIQPPQPDSIEEGDQERLPFFVVA